MSERKILKKELAQLIAYRNQLPGLIDCSVVYGDGYFCVEDTAIVNAEIKQIKLKIENLNANPI